jgi:DNA (cytosine-5)-methyltransferase 1
MGSNKRNGPRSLVQVAREMWPTPHANCHTGAGAQGRQGGLNIQTAVKMYPTPMVGSTSEASHNQISGRFREGMKRAGVSGCLNPEWIEWLMGYPIGHTASAPSETQSSRKSRKPSCAN